MANANQIDDWQDVGVDDWQDVDDWRDESPKPIPVGMGDSAIHGGVQGVTLGFADEIAAGGGALYDYLQGKLGNRGEISLGDAYNSYLPHIRKDYKDAYAANPSAYSVGEVAGAIAPSAVGIGAVGGASSLGKLGAGVGMATASGAVAGGGYSENDADSPGFVGDIVKGGLLGAATFGAAKGAGKLADKTGVVDKAKGWLSGLPDYFQDIAEKRAFKASTGQNKKAFVEAERMGQVNSRGRALLDEEIVTPLARVEDIAQRSKLQGGQVGERIGETLEALDDFMPQPVDGKKIAERITNYAESISAPNNESVVHNLMRQAEQFENMGNISLKEAQRLKGTYRFKPTDSTTQTLGQDGTNALRRAINEEMEESIRVIGELSPEANTAYQKWMSDKTLYGHLRGAEKTATERSLANQSNRFVSPSDYGVGGLGYLGTGDPVTATALALGNKFARERGSSLVAVGADKVSDILRSMPQRLGPYADILSQAAQRGDYALGAAHHTLWQRDPRYRSMFINGKDGFSAKTLQEEDEPDIDY